MISSVKGILRDENANELNELIVQLIRNLEMENEAIIETIMDITLDNNERREKTFWETVRNPENYQELLTLQTKNETLSGIISELKDIIYSDYKHVPVTSKRESKIIRSPNLSKKECMLWLATLVKPKILEGMVVNNTGDC